MDENCQQKILSEEYYDFLLYETELRVGNTSELEEGYCIQNIANDFGILYIAGGGLPPLNYENYRYADIPLLYTLVQEMQTAAIDYEALVDSGIIYMQESPLSLKGRGVLTGYIDTGERVIIMSS